MAESGYGFVGLDVAAGAVHVFVRGVSGMSGSEGVMVDRETQEARETVSDPTFEQLSETIARYPAWGDKLTIALGNFNRVRAERDVLAVRLAEAEEALRDDVTAFQRMLMWATPVGKDYDEDTAFTELRRIARERIGAASRKEQSE